MSRSLLRCRADLNLYLRPLSRPNTIRWLTTSNATDLSSSTSTQPPPVSHLENQPTTHYKITLKRSAISLGDKIKGTLIALGIHRRFQTVYHRHSPEAAGKILRVKELVHVENVPENLVQTKQEQRLERKAPRGYKVVGSRRGTFMNV